MDRTRVAALYDIHGNLPALEAVLAEVAAEGVQRIVVGGDVVPGPLAGACLERLRALALMRERNADVAVGSPPGAAWMPSIDFIRGNGEADVVRVHRGEPVPRVPERLGELLRWTADTLDPEQVAAIATWPATVRLDLPGLGDVLFCHATPRDDWEIFTRLSPEAALRQIFEPTGADIVVCGHTHMPVDRTVGSVRVVTAGSVGLPFGEGGAHWLMLDQAGVEFRVSDYDRSAAMETFAASGYPGLAEVRIVEPRSEREMLDAFAPVTLGLDEG